MRSWYDVTRLSSSGAQKDRPKEGAQEVPVGQALVLSHYHQLLLVLLFSHIVRVMFSCYLVSQCYYYYY